MRLRSEYQRLVNVFDGELARMRLRRFISTQQSCGCMVLIFSHSRQAGCSVLIPPHKKSQPECFHIPDGSFHYFPYSLFFLFPALSMKGSASTMKRVWSAVPTSPAESSARMVNVIFFPFTPVTTAVAVTVSPGSVGAL